MPRTLHRPAPGSGTAVAGSIPAEPSTWALGEVVSRHPLEMTWGFKRWQCEWVNQVIGQWQPNSILSCVSRFESESLKQFMGVRQDSPGPQPSPYSSMAEQSTDEMWVRVPQGALMRGTSLVRGDMVWPSHLQASLAQWEERLVEAQEVQVRILGEARGTRWLTMPHGDPLVTAKADNSHRSARLEWVDT